MAEPFLGEIRMFSSNYVPTTQGWAMCNGQLLPINQNQALFSLLGTTYGGNGQTNFALPDLRGMVPIHVGAGFVQGQKAGEQAHTLSLNEMPAHTHVLSGSSAAANNALPGGNLMALSPQQVYIGTGALVPMVAGSVTNVGGGQAHANMQPFLTLTFGIALQGIFPSQN